MSLIISSSSENVVSGENFVSELSNELTSELMLDKPSLLCLIQGNTSLVNGALGERRQVN